MLRECCLVTFARPRNHAVAKLICGQLSPTSPVSDRDRTRCASLRTTYGQLRSRRKSKNARMQHHVKHLDFPPPRLRTRRSGVRVPPGAPLSPSRRRGRIARSIRYPIWRIGQLGIVAADKGNRGGRETNVGFGRLEPVLSRPRPPFDRARDARHVVGLLKRAKRTRRSFGGKAVSTQLVTSLR